MLTLLLLLTGSVLSGQNEKPVNSALYQASTEAYVLGPDDQIVIRAFEAEEISDKAGGDRSRRVDFAIFDWQITCGGPKRP
jgi:hypothetical protein